MAGRPLIPHPRSKHTRRKGGTKFMKYAKPEIVLQTDALQVIRGMNKSSQVAADNAPPHLITATTNAYEADE